MTKALPGCWALIPIKPPGTGKTRLAGVLDASGREGLVSAMLDRVIAAVRGCPDVIRICLLTSGERTLGGDLSYLADDGAGLNPALQGALGALSEQGGRRVIVVAADLPLLTPADLALMADVSADTIAIAPDRHGTGTNALSLPQAALARFQVRFGPGSHSAHRLEAIRLGYTVETMLSDGLEKDIDDPADLADAGSCLQEAR